jgi:hypothetical protein
LGILNALHKSVEEETAMETGLKRKIVEVTEVSCNIKTPLTSKHLPSTYS